MILGEAGIERLASLRSCDHETGAGWIRAWAAATVSTSLEAQAVKYL